MRVAEAEDNLSTSPRRRVRPEVVVALAAAAFAAVAALVASAQGAGISNDSTVYVSSGLNFAAGDGLRDWSDRIVTVFPPGLPFVVAVGRQLGVGADWAVRVLNASAFAGTVWLGFLLLRGHVRSRALVIGATVLVAVSVPLLDGAKMVWTEPVFIVACLGLLLVLERLSVARRIVPLLAAAVALVWVAFMFRYAAVVLIPIGALAVVLVRRRQGWAAALGSAAGFALAAAIVPVAWMVRNHAVDGTFLGPRYPSTDTPVSFAKPFVTTLGSWVLPSPVPAIVQGLVGITLLAALAGAIVWSVVEVVRHGERPGDETATVPLAPLFCFVTLYATFLAATQLTTAVDLVDSRLMSPLYVPLIVLGAVGLDRLAARVPERRAGVVVGGVAAVLVALLAVQTALFARSVRASAVNGEDYTARAWQNSPTVEAARRLPTDTAVYSNSPGGVWAATRREPVRRTPQARSYRSDESYEVPESFVRNTTCRESYLVWFDLKNDFHHSPAELARYVELDPVRVASDGAVYRIRPRADTSTPVTC